MQKRRDTKGRVLRPGESQRPDGRYEYRYVDQNGRRQSVYSWRLVATDATPLGKQNAPPLRETIKKISANLDNGICFSDANSTTIDDLFRLYIEMRTDLKFSTLTNYNRHYRLHIQPLLGNLPVASIRHSHIQKFVLQLHDKGLRASSVYTMYAIVRQLLQIAVHDNLIANNPASDAMKALSRALAMETQPRHALSLWEQQTFLGYTAQSQKYQRYYNLFIVLLGTGMRIGEALGLRWCDCDFQSQIIHVEHTLSYAQTTRNPHRYRLTEPKTRAGIREIPMLPDVVTALQNEQKRCASIKTDEFNIDGYSDFIFLNNTGKPFTPQFIYGVLQELVKAYNKAELQNAAKENREPQLLPRFSPHNLRHTFCTRLCECNVNIKVVQTVMGHSNSRTTMEVYNEATSQFRRQCFANLNGNYVIQASEATLCSS